MASESFDVDGSWMEQLMPSAHVIADIMDRDHQDALTHALEECLSQHQDSVWPCANDVKFKDVDIIVLPLDRIGGSKGKTTAHVFVAYYSQRQESEAAIGPSPSLAVKVDERKKMWEELQGVRQWPQLSPSIEKHFAKPIMFEPAGDNLAVLIAPFRSVDETNPGRSRRDVKLDDLWQLLNAEDWARGDEAGSELKDVGTHLERTLDLASRLHLGNDKSYQRKTSTYGSALRWYLRNTCAIEGSNGSKRRIPKNIFGDEPSVRAFGREWPNPRCVIDRLLESAREFEAATGSVHGDLHPKNIVLDQDGELYIIDFGWACNGAPVVVDYIMLDINLRSITLPSQVGAQDVLDIANFLSIDRQPTDPHPLIEARIKLIRDKIWPRLNAGVVQDWITEYIVPFFMVAYGLLVHLDSARNQMALVATVLAAGELVDQEEERRQQRGAP